MEEQELQGHGGTSGKRKPPYPSEQASLAGDGEALKQKLPRMGWFEQHWFVLIMLP